MVCSSRGQKTSEDGSCSLMPPMVMLSSGYFLDLIFGQEMKSSEKESKGGKEGSRVEDQSCGKACRALEGDSTR